MSIWTKIGGALGIKALTQMQFPGRSFAFFDFPKVDDDQMAKEVGDGTSSDIVMTPVRWLQRAFNESVIVVRVDDEIDPNHELSALISNPNPFYSSEHLYAGTVFSLSTHGTAYWLKVRNGNGAVKELWWVPHNVIEPKWPDDGETFISHYIYKVAGKEIKLEVDDVIQFRDGVDPSNMRLGLSPLKGLLREIWSDNEAASFTASLMRNGGVPGVVISPKNADFEISHEEAELLKDKFVSEFGRERRGTPMVMNGPIEAKQFGFSPQELDLSPLRNISEERVTAALGVPAAVVGFGAGLQQTKVGATMRELRQLAWHNGVIPLQRIIAGAVERSLLPDFADKGKVIFDNSDVAALADDENKHFERVERMVKSGVWTRAEGREETGKEVNPNDNVYLLPINIIEVPVGQVRQIEKCASKDVEMKDHSHSLLERQIEASAPRGKPTSGIERFAVSIDRIRATFPAVMEDELREFFNDMGEETERVALSVFDETRSTNNIQIKRDSLDAKRIAEGMDLLGLEASLRQLYERQYLRVGEESLKALEGFLGLEVGIPDIVARAIIATGGRRAGLLDLTGKIRRKLFDRIIEGRIAGLAGDNLARFIRAGVEAGPWSTATIRAKVIARTETAFATNVSVVEGARTITGVEKMMILDARAGDTDALCESLNGAVVTIEEARQLAADEHPNGTRSFSPLTPQLIEEMGL